MGGCMSLHRKNTIAEFLVVLRESDYRSGFFSKSYYKKLLKKRESIPGKLTIIKFNEINKHQYILIKDIVVPRLMYIKLPKENIYVKSNEWEYEYLKSQLQELIYIFGSLGAKKLTYNLSNNNIENKNIGVSLLTSNLPIENKIKIENKILNEKHFNGHIKYAKSIIKPSFELLKQDKSLYYVYNKYDWKQIIQRRLKNYVLNDEFTYKFISELNFDFELKNMLKNIGISFNYNSSSIFNFSINFNVEYYELSKKLNNRI